MEERIIDIHSILRDGLEQYMRGYLLQLRNITDGAVWNEIDINEDNGYEIREIIVKAEEEIRELGISRGIFAPELQNTKGFDSYCLWKMLKGEDVETILSKQKLRIEQDGLKSLIQQLEKLVED